MNNEDHKELLETVSQIVKNNEIKMNQNPSIIEFIPQENNRKTHIFQLKMEKIFRYD